MDIYTAIPDYIAALLPAPPWSEVSDLVAKAAERRDHNWLLPVICGQAVGAAPAILVPAAAALACMQIQIILIDDMLDADPRGLHNTLGMPVAANLAAALEAAAFTAICRSAATRDAQLAIVRSLAEMGFVTRQGQSLDTLNPSTEDSYWLTVRTKSAPFFAAAFYIGALMAGADERTASQLKRLGGLYGEIIQIFDDVHDTMSMPANPDWLLGRSPLPVLFAQSVPHPDRQEFITLRATIAEPDHLAAAQTILIRCGAISYCIDQIYRRHRQACHLLEALTLADNHELQALLQDVIEPVQRVMSQN